MKRDQVVYIPCQIRADRINEYTSNMIGILQERYKVTGVLAEPANILQMMQTKAVFLNWVEDDLDLKMKLQLLLHKAAGVKIIWVFHNKYPHDREYSERIVSNMRWLADHSSVVMLHSENSRRFIPNRNKNSRKAKYIPHVLFNKHNQSGEENKVREHYGVKETDFLFTIFGAVKPYKNIEAAIDAFQKLHLEGAKLLIAGKSADHAYALEIEERCRQDNNIILDLHFIQARLLEQIIEASDVIVMPYKDVSSMNSRVMIHSFSLGRTVISPDICMARDFKSKGFLYVYKSSLERAMKKAYMDGCAVCRMMGEEARKYMKQYHSETIVKRNVMDMLEK
ncbi:MAG: glycosyltransferase [Clostridiales bacterium]|nr:glycosyltransferase [Clostridiales bacterium]